MEVFFMAISFEKAFGIYPQSIQVSAERAEIIAGNIANNIANRAARLLIL